MGRAVTGHSRMLMWVSNCGAFCQNLRKYGLTSKSLKEISCVSHYIYYKIPCVEEQHKMKKSVMLVIASTSLLLSACGAKQPLEPGELEANQAGYLEFTKSQCTSVLGGSGVGELTRASAKLQKKAAAMGVVRDYSSPDPGLATAWSFSVGMQGRLESCNDFVTKSYNIMSATNTL